MICAEIDGSYFVRAEVGDTYPGSFAKLAASHRWGCAAISGIGGVDQVVLSYYDLSSKSYQDFAVDGIVELVQMSGNLSHRDGQPFWHCHAMVGDRLGNLRGGHLVSFTVALTVECWINPHARVIEREFEPHLGLNVLKL